MYRGIFLARSSSCRRRTTDNMSTVDRALAKAALFLGAYSRVLAVVAKAGRDDFQHFAGMGTKRTPPCSCCKQNDPSFCEEGLSYLHLSIAGGLLPFVSPHVDKHVVKAFGDFGVVGFQ